MLVGVNLFVSWMQKWTVVDGVADIVRSAFKNCNRLSPPIFTATVRTFLVTTPRIYDYFYINASPILQVIVVGQLIHGLRSEAQITDEGFCVQGNFRIVRRSWPRRLVLHCSSCPSLAFKTTNNPHMSIRNWHLYDPPPTVQ